MDKEVILKRSKDRLNRLEQNGKNIKSAGVIKKLKREIRNLEKEKKISKYLIFIDWAK